MQPFPHLKKAYPRLYRWVLNAIICISIRERQKEFYETDIHRGEGDTNMKQRDAAMKDAKSHPKLEEARKGPP